MEVAEIVAVKKKLDEMKKRGVIKAWELPYENLLTRLDAAIFFFDPSGEFEESITGLQESLKQFGNFHYKQNENTRMSSRSYRFSFAQEEN